MKTGAIALGVLALLALFYNLSMRFGPKSAIQNSASLPVVDEKPQISEDDLRGQVWARACDVIRKRLDAPGSARFPKRFEEGVEIVTGDRSSVIGFVDAKTTLGGERRMKWKVVLRSIEGGEKYAVDQVELD